MMSAKYTTPLYLGDRFFVDTLTIQPTANAETEKSSRPVNRKPAK